jgi:D-sedoheptulose 7-phosphate isomerase
MVLLLRDVRDRKGRLFLVGLGGSAANCSHAASDFRKLAGIQAVSLCDNVAEITARANDEGFHGIYSEALNASNPKADDALFVFSVGGGSGGVSEPLVQAVNAARYNGMNVLGVVGRDGGHTKQYGDCVILVPNVEPSRVTPHTEAFHMVVLHCLVSHPVLQKYSTKW